MVNMMVNLIRGKDVNSAEVYGEVSGLMEAHG